MRNGIARSVGCAVLVALTGCGSSGATARPIDAGPPIADPGGSFTTSVAPDRPIGDLNLIETDTLCRDFATAYYGFLMGGVQTQTLCRETVATVAAESMFFDGGGFSDGGTDGGLTCEQAFAECLGSNFPTAFECPIPIAENPPQACDATVEDLSACLNEIAALDPIDLCSPAGGCDGGPVTTIGFGIASDGARTAHAPTPACDRLQLLCPAIAGWASFPC
jgi:hypothetical protein